MSTQQKNNELVRFSCAKGHALAAEKQHAGKTRACPKCGVPVRIPLDPDKDMDQILEVLFEETETKEVAKGAIAARAAEYYRPKSDRNKHLCRCPNCKRLNPKNYRICVNCKGHLSIKPSNG